MSDFLDRLAARRRFGMRPSLDAIRGVCAALGDPQKELRAIHIAGTNGKGAVCAMIDACLRSGGLRACRYTSPHLVRINERFFVDGKPVDDATLESAADKVFHADSDTNSQLTFFEALTAVAFIAFSETKCDYAVLETGLGGRLDATNICVPEICVITKIGLDHCDWLGDTVEKIAAEKAGIIKKGVPIVLGKNDPEVIAVVKARASEVGAPFFYAPDMADESEIPDGFSLEGAFNRENAVTALAALKVLSQLESSKGLLGQTLCDTTQTLTDPNPTLCDTPLTLNDPKQTLSDTILKGLCNVVWPGRFQRVGRFIIDGAHNPPAARALAAALSKYAPFTGSVPTLIAGFCGDKDVDETLRILAPLVGKGIAVRTNNPRSLAPEELARKMEAAGIPAISCDSIHLALEKMGSVPSGSGVDTLICGSLFLAGEALAELGAFPWQADRFDAAEILKV
ncbi:MAG: bifunctional folylpolyglutamate synthase/dihydrofolate synthase [Kiritimatiellae bacterium]|nr:bifunctional folylpolyglutamate synthase/dihydrofolate synthase [Kiritimatiellia bacterium]